MTYLDFKPFPLTANEVFLELPDDILGDFHAFQVTATSKEILEARKEHADGRYNHLPYRLDEPLWFKIFEYMTPKDIFTTIIATRNLNGKFSINHLRNYFFYTRYVHHDLISPCDKDERPIRFRFNAHYETALISLAYRLPLLELASEERASDIDRIAFSNFAIEGKKNYLIDYSKTQINHARVNSFNPTLNPIPKPSTLKSYRLNGNRINLVTLQNYLSGARELASLYLMACNGTMISPDDLKSLSLNKLIVLELYNCKLPPHFIRHLLNSSPNLESLTLEYFESEENFEFEKLIPDSLPKVTRLILNNVSLTCASLMGLARATSSFEYLDLDDTEITGENGLDDLLPDSLKSVQSIKAEGQNIYYLPNILKAAPNLKHLNMALWKGEFVDDTQDLTFPNLLKLNISCNESDSDPGSEGLLTLVRMFPNLKILDIYCFSDELYDIKNVFKNQKPMLSLEVLKCFGSKTSEEALECLLSLTPNLKKLKLSIDCISKFEITFPRTSSSESYDDESYDENIEQTEEMMSKFARLILKGYQVVADALEREHFKKEPHDKELFNKILENERQKMAPALDVAANSNKHSLEDKEDSAPKRTRQG